jgi:hypothetical protein
MYLKSLVATDYSTGKSYTYSDKSGTWQSITSEGGQINGNAGAESISTVESAPPVTATINSAPIPFSGTHRETSSFVTPSIWPWVPKPTTLSSSVAKSTTLPSGWTFSGSRQVQPPSAASVSEHSPSVASAAFPMRHADAFLSLQHSLRPSVRQLLLFRRRLHLPSPGLKPVPSLRSRLV